MIKKIVSAICLVGFVLLVSVASFAANISIAHPVNSSGKGLSKLGWSNQATVIEVYNATTSSVTVNWKGAQAPVVLPAGKSVFVRSPIFGKDNQTGSSTLGTTAYHFTVNVNSDWFAASFEDREERPWVAVDNAVADVSASYAGNGHCWYMFNVKPGEVPSYWLEQQGNHTTTHGWSFGAKDNGLIDYGCGAYGAITFAVPLPANMQGIIMVYGDGKTALPKYPFNELAIPAQSQKH